MAIILFPFSQEEQPVRFLEGLRPGSLGASLYGNRVQYIDFFSRDNGFWIGLLFSCVLSLCLVSSAYSLESKQPNNFERSSADISFSDTPMTVSKTSARILGGTVASRGYPWMLSLQALDVSGQYRHLCGAVAIAPNAALTAAHCLNDFESGLFRVHRRFDNSLTNSGATHRAVVQAIQHPYYQAPSLEYDIAVIRWVEPMSDLEPIRLGVADELNGGGQGKWGVVEPESFQVSSHWLGRYSGEQFLSSLYDYALPVSEKEVDYKILGWGVTDAEDLSSLSETLQEGGVELFSRQVCDRTPLNRVASSFCAGLFDGTVDSCLGDSGGPLIRVQKLSEDSSTEIQPETYSLVGLVSYGGGCGVAGQPGFYTDVMQFLPFIYGVVQGRDHWIPAGALGQGVVHRKGYSIYNFNVQPLQFGSMSLTEPEGVQVDGLSCEWAQLFSGQQCEILYQLTAHNSGNFYFKTEFQYTLNSAEGRALNRTGYLLAVGQGWYSGGDQPWQVDTQAYVAGGYSLRSGPIQDRQASLLQGYFSGPQVVTAYVLVDSEADYDELKITVGDRLVFAGSDIRAWQPVTLNIPAQGAIVTFNYFKDASLSVGRDTAWIDFQSLDASGRSLETLNFVTNTAIQNNPDLLRQDNSSSSSGGGFSMQVIVGFLMMIFGRCWLVDNWLKVKGLFSVNHSKLSSKGLCFLILSASLSACASSSEAELSKEHIQAPKPPQVNLGQHQGKTSNTVSQYKPQAEPLYSKQYKLGKLYIQVRSLGCTNSNSFRLIESNERTGWYTVERVVPDYCRRAPMIMTVALPIPRKIEQKLITSGHGNKIPLTNIQVPNTGIPEIPFD